MRKLLTTACFLLVVMWLASTIEYPNKSFSTSTPSINEWRRTVDGWERTSDWRRSRIAPTAPPAASFVHPGLIASLQVLISLGSLFAFENSSFKGATVENAA